MTTWIAVTVALVVGTGAPFLWVPVLRRLGVVDVPNERSSHNETTLRGVGVGPASGIAAAIGVLIWAESTPGLAVAVLATALVVSLVGLAEDVRGLSVRLRLGLQLGMALIFGVALVVLADAPWWVAGISVLAITASVNVANFMDGIDGISAFYGVVVGAHYAVVGAVEGLTWLVGAGLVITAAFLAFIPWNLGRRRVFLGDVGSYLLGALVACTGITYIAGGGYLVLALAPAALYVADTGTTLLSRAWRGEPVLQAHRSHVYQRLTQAGWPHVAVAGLVAGGTAACCLLAHVITMGGAAAVAGVLAMALVIIGYLAAPLLVSRSRSVLTAP